MQNLQELRSEFFDKSDLLFAIFDENLNLIDANETALRSFQFSKEAILGKNIAELSPDSGSSGRVELYREVMRTGESLVIDEIQTHVSLGTFYFRIRAFKLNSGLGLTLNNITDLKNTIGDMENFIYMITHDMRSPVANILGITNLLEGFVNDLDEAKRLGAMIQNQTTRLDQILQVLMDVIKMRKGEKSIQLLSFNEIVDEVLLSLKYVNGYDQIKFSKDITDTVSYYNDKVLIISILQNLIDNAIKYRRSIPDSFVNIAVKDHEQGILITVTDNGIGIADHMQSDVYKMFFRATDQASGTGLGLYTIHHTIKKLGGHITLKSEYNSGTEFRVFLPSDKQQQ